MNRITLTIVILFAMGLVSQSYSQTFIGGQIDNYSGVHSVLLNPANVVGSKMKLDINLFSTSGFVGNDYLSLNLSDLKKFRDEFDFNTKISTSPNSHNNFFGNIDVLGPSVQFNIGDKNSIAITSRLRTFFNLHNLGGELYEVASDGDSDESFNISMEDLSGIAHVWGEIGGTFGRIIIDQQNQRLKAGATFKYLFGAGGIYGNSNQLGAEFNVDQNSLGTSGNLNYGYTSGFESGDISYSDLQSGFGVDLGLVYELFSKGNISDRSSYKLKIGASVSDIGAINYAGTFKARYIVNAIIDAAEFQNKDLSDVLDDNYPGSKTTEKVKMGLPTALQLFVDYHIKNNFFLSAQGAISIKKWKAIPVSRLINTMTVTPRFETKWFSIYSPISIRQYDSSIAWGIGFRAGPVMVGSGSVLTNMLSERSKSTDLYFGLKIPLYKKNN